MSSMVSGNDEMLALPDDTDPSAGARRSRRLGVLTLLVGLLVALIGSAILKVDVTGHAAPQPLPAPPAVGTCVLVGEFAVESTSCADLHNAEVVQTWAAGDPLPSPAPSFPMLTEIPFGTDFQCYQAEAAYLGYGATGNVWTPFRPLVFSRLISAPRDQRTPTQGWTACVLGSGYYETYTGTLHDGTITAASPSSSIGRCIVTPGSAGATDCARPHRIELIGYLNVSPTATNGKVSPTLDPAMLDRTCADLVLAETGAADPTYGGGLRVSAQVVFRDWVYQAVTTDGNGQPVIVSLPAPFCIVEVVGDHPLTNTVIGLGNQPLPLD